MKKTLIVIAAATLIPLGAAVAGEGKDKAGSMGPSFDTLDTNRDGRVSQAEAATDSTIMFTTADANGDGYLDKKEYRAAQKSHGSDPQPQSMPQSPDSTSSPAPSSDPTLPQPSASEPQPDTETPRQ